MENATPKKHTSNMIPLISLAAILLAVGSFDKIMEWCTPDTLELDILKHKNWYRLFSLVGSVCVTISGVIFGIAITATFDSSKQIKGLIVNINKSLQKLLCNTRTTNCILGSSSQEIEQLVDKEYYLYMITTTQEEPLGCWVCYKTTFKESPPSCLTATIHSSLGDGVSYKIEAFVRKNQLIMAINPLKSPEKNSSFTFPNFCLNWGKPMCGIGIGETYTEQCIVRSAILSPSRIDDINEGFVDKKFWTSLDTVWSKNFILPKILTASNSLRCKPIVGYWISKAYKGSQTIDIAFIHFYESAEGKVQVNSIVVDSQGAILDTHFISNSSDIQGNKLHIIYNRPSAHNSIGVALYIFDSADKNGLYTRYTGHFTDDKTSDKTLVCAQRLPKEKFCNVENSSSQSSKLSLTMFTKELAAIDQRIAENKS